MMLPKDLDWRMLSHSDGQVVRSNVEYGGREAMTVLRLRPIDAFLKQCQRDKSLADCYEVCLAVYEDLHGLYEIKHDAFGGYCLFYVGEDRIRPGDLFPSSPVGFLATIPDNITELSVIQKISSPGVSFLMLGPVRFVNSDCDPNAVYDFSSDLKVVKLRAIKSIYPNTEILVKYSEDFFESFSCLCATCEQSTSLENSRILYSESVLKEVVDEEIGSVVEHPLSEKALSDSKAVSRKRPDRVFWADKLRAFKVAYESDELLFDRSPESTTSEDPVGFSQSQVFHTSDVANHELTSNSASSPSIPLQTKISSPLPERNCHSPHFSGIVSSVTSEYVNPKFEESSLTTMGQPLYAGADIGVNNAILLLLSFCSKFHLSDFGMQKLYELVDCLLPEENKLPPQFSFIYKMKTNKRKMSLEAKQLSRGEVCVLSFTDFLKQIVERNLETMFSYSEHKEKSKVINDFPIEKVKPVHRCSTVLKVQLIFSTDGVSIVNSSNTSLWPFWLAVANLPPKLRMAQKNISLASLFVGNSKPLWEEIVPQIAQELRKKVHVSGLSAKYEVRFEVMGIVADLIAKCSLLNMVQLVF